MFRTVYKRRRKINPSDVDTHVDYEDETGEKFQEYNVYHHNFVKWLEASGYDTSKLATISDAELNEWVAASPYHGATANDIDWVAKVKMQGAIQKWVDHSISVTVNLPNNVSEALVTNTGFRKSYAICTIPLCVADSYGSTTRSQAAKYFSTSLSGI